jgi:lipoate---protein ligase
MVQIINHSTDPFFNLALEEYFLKNSNDEIFILYRNSAAIIIGKHQLPYAETNSAFLDERKIPLIRRISGGGTVFHDPGNVNFCFILNGSEGKLANFELHTRPILYALSQMGIEAVFEGHNDLRVEGYKISGNAEHVFRNRVIHHGTLLFNADLGILSEGLKSNPACFETKAIPSVRSKVANISTFISQGVKVNEFMHQMAGHIGQYLNITQKREPSPIEVTATLALAESKYKLDEWNYAYSPSYRFRNDFLLGHILCKIELVVEKGVIQSAKTNSVFSPVSQIAPRLIGNIHIVKTVSQILSSFNFGFAPADYRLLLFSFFQDNKLLQ